MKCVEVYKELYHQEPFDVAFCPYRISPLGAHIDHQYGKINGLAIDKGIHMAYHPKQNGVVELQSLNFPKRAQFFVSAVPDEKQGDWADHLRGAAKMLGEKYRLKVGLSGIIEGSLPIGGLSSSASVIICFLSALCKVNGMVDKPETIETQRFEDFRGWLSVPVDKSIDFRVVQIDQGFSRKAGTLRGLHFQEGEHAQAKLVSCLYGSIFNVAVDLRPGDTFGYAYGEILSFENQKQMLIPRGFAHGYLTLEDDTLMQWCVDNDFCGEAARAVRYDSDFIWQTEPWPMREYILSEKDKNAIKLSELRKF